MPPQIALLVFSLFVLGCLIVDSRRKQNISVALWVPLIWLAILASRPLGIWFDPSYRALNESVEEGSLVDRAVLTALIVIAPLVLLRRKVQWARWLRENPWVVLLFLYCGLSIGWSDFPYVALKRLFRALGSLMMILLVLSEAEPIAAVGTLVRRCGYILVPFSILLNKYYRDMAVVYDQWSGREYLAGVTTDKNALGRLCLVVGIFTLSDIVAGHHGKDIQISKLARCVSIIMFLVTVWLLLQSQSATSLASFVVGSGIFLGLGLPIVRKNVRYLGTFTVLAIAVVVTLGVSVNLAERAVTSLGRNMTLTDRTYIWTDLLDRGTNPFVGVGYDSFWVGDRLDELARKYQINEAHNGFLEMYLELGLIGLCILFCLVATTFWRAKRLLSRSVDFNYGRLCLTMLMVFLLYNMTESASRITTLMFFLLLLLAIDVPTHLRSLKKADATARPLPAYAVPRRRFEAVRSPR